MSKAKPKAAKTKQPKGAKTKQAKAAKTKPATASRTGKTQAMPATRRRRKTRELPIGRISAQPPAVGILLGSASDLRVFTSALELLKQLEIPFELAIRSAHRCPEETGAYVESARQRGMRVLIAGAGMAAHLAGAVAARTTLPVIGVPIASGALSGEDALLATVQMPPGIPVATVAIDGAKNAVYLAAQIIALDDPALGKRLEDDRTKRKEAILATPAIRWP